MNGLLDTCAFLYWVSGDSKLSPLARRTIEDPANTIFFSAASAMELAIKQRSGKLTLPEAANLYVPKKLAEYSFQVIDIRVEHALHVYAMDWHHKDPFDLLLLSQSILLGIPILTDDSQFQAYPVTVIW